MKILLLGKANTRIANFLEKNEDTINTENKVGLDFIKKENPDFIVSYNYRYIIPKEIIDLHKGKIVNLHISLLPWNKGADPNLWSFLDDTPKGVTIHEMTEKVDAGDILLQKKMYFSKEETLETSYVKLQEAIQDLFIENWDYLKNNKIERKPQVSKGTYHRKKDKNSFFYLFPDGWQTEVKKAKEIYEKVRLGTW